jgi:hypothetical protein
MLHFERIVEEKIRQALGDGAFENLPGAGKPLKLDDDSRVPPDLRIAYKLLKDAHCLPPELELHKEILQMKDLLREIDDQSERVRKIREINLLITGLNLLRKCPLSLEAQQMVVSRLSNRNDPTVSQTLSADTFNAKS